MNAPATKRGPKKTDRATERANATKLKLRLLDLLIGRAMSVKEMAEALDCNAKTLRDYLHRMTNEGLVVSVLVKGYCGAPTAAIYTLGAQSFDVTGDRKSQRTRTTYPLHHVRDELHTALFGPAKQHGEHNEQR
jgi:predicted ArsR family transcriptional regulator